MNEKLSTFEKRSKMTLRRLQPRITQIDTYIHTDILIKHTGYDVTDYFHLLKLKKRPKMPHPTASLLYFSRTV